jgi:para-nitrobenzyl esterase
VRRAIRFGPVAPQPVARGGLVDWLRREETGQSEDCLYLNIWTPGCDGRRRPVMVWIHGGGFTQGSGSSFLFSGAHLARRGDLVVVTLNYRLGALGFLDPSGLPVAAEWTANAGLRDLIAALRWVRDNIHCFGGDPESLTAFGQSAGAMCIATLLATPAARGLFQRAILQSGAADNIAGPEQARRVAETLLQRLRIEPPHAAALGRVPVPELLRAQQETGRELSLQVSGMPWQPSLDPDLLPEAPLAAIAKGDAAAVPLLIGTNRDEWNLFMFGDAKGRRLDEAALQRRFARALPGSDAAGTPLAELAREAYRRAGTAGPSDAPRQRWAAFQTDRAFRYPALQLADAHSAHQPATYAYRFDWSPPLAGSRVGAFHGIELPFVFGTLSDGWLRPTLGLQPSARRLSRRVQEAWIAFARSGDPAHSGLPDWPTYTREEGQTLVFASRDRVEGPLFERARSFWSRREGAAV